jgi:hypothetical protein
VNPKRLLASFVAACSAVVFAQTIPAVPPTNQPITAPTGSFAGDVMVGGVVSAGGFDGGAGVFSSLRVTTGPNQISGATTFGSVVSAPTFDGGSIAGTTLTTSGVNTFAGALNAQDAGFNNVTLATLTATTADATSLKGDSLQTHTGGASQMNVCTTGTGNCVFGNATSGALSLGGSVLSYPGIAQINGAVSVGAASVVYPSFSGGASTATITTNGTNGNFSASAAGSGTSSFGTTGTGSTVLGNATGGVTLVSGSAITASCANTATLDFASALVGACSADLTITLSCSTTTSSLSWNVPNGAMVAGSMFQAWVSSAGTVSVRHCCQAGTSCDPASGAFYVRAFVP